jgi:uncharacterized membrane protein YgdD (TMEM256/DUF423 family)
MPWVFLMLAAFGGFTSVALGAFAAHGLKARLSLEQLAVFQTGTHYQMFHSLALLAVALLLLHAPSRLLRASGVLFAVGILLFSGSLYLLTLMGIPRLGMVTPLGGLSFLVGWLCLGLAAWRMRA